MNIGREDAIESYLIALRIISEFGARIDSEECAQIAWRGETADINWLLAWTPPEDGS